VKFPRSGLDNETRQERTRHRPEHRKSSSATLPVAKVRAVSVMLLICQGCARSVPLEEGPPPPYFSQVFILKVVKVLCFDTLLQVFILKVVTARPLDSTKLPIEAGLFG
jgi:hypothetical protein